MHSIYHGFKHDFLTRMQHPLFIAQMEEASGDQERGNSCQVIIDPKWNYRSELRDLLRYHKMGGWIIPWMLIFPKLSRDIAENLGGLYDACYIHHSPYCGLYKVCAEGLLGDHRKIGSKVYKVFRAF